MIRIFNLRSFTKTFEVETLKMFNNLSIDQFETSTSPRATPGHLTAAYSRGPGI